MKIAPDFAVGTLLIANASLITISALAENARKHNNLRAIIKFFICINSFSEHFRNFDFLNKLIVKNEYLMIM